LARGNHGTSVPSQEKVGEAKAECPMKGMANNSNSVCTMPIIIIDQQSFAIIFAYK